MEVLDSRREPVQELQEWLAREFAGTVPRTAIDEAANDAFREFEGARIRAFVPVSRGAAPATSFGGLREALR